MHAAYLFLALLLPLSTAAPRRWLKKDLTFSVDSRGSGMIASETRKAIHTAFYVWSAVVPLKFKEVSTGADIKIRFASGDHGDAYPFDGEGNQLYHVFYPEKGEVHFDADEHWTVMSEQNLPVDTAQWDFLTMAIHATGHALGLRHSHDPASIMAPTSIDTKPVDEEGNYAAPKLDAGTIRVIQRMYGEAE